MVQMVFTCENMGAAWCAEPSQNNIGSSDGARRFFAKNNASCTVSSLFWQKYSSSHGAATFLVIRLRLAPFAAFSEKNMTPRTMQLKKIVMQTLAAQCSRLLL